MKKLSLLLAILMIAAMFSSFAYAVDGTQATTVARENGVVHAIKRTNPITIDGLIGSNEDWNKAEINEFTIVSGKIEVRFRAMWDEDYVYLLYEVKDSTMIDDNGAYENSISTTYNAIDTAATGANGAVYNNVAQFFIKCDSIGFAFDALGKASAGAPSFTGYVGLYGAVGKRTLVWDDTFYSVATKEDGTKYYESWFKSSIVRDSEDKAIGYIMEGKVDLKQHGENFSNPDRCPANYAKYGYTGLTYDVGSKFSFGAYVNNVETVGTRENYYAWPTAMNTGSTMTGWGTMELVAGDAKVDNSGRPSSDAFFGSEIDDSVKVDTTQKVTYAIAGTPTIDGAVDAIWANAEVNKIEKITVGTSSDIEARFRTMWDEEYLYILAEVKDATPNGDKGAALEQAQSGVQIVFMDSILFSFDANYSRGSGLEADKSGYLIKGVYGGTYADKAHKNDEGGYGDIFHGGDKAINTGYTYDDEFFQTTRLESGYIMEGKVALTNLAGAEYDVLTAGQCIGLNVMVNDNNAGGTSVGGRASQLSWNSAQNTVPSAFGSIVLVEDDSDIKDENKVAADDNFLASNLELVKVQTSAVDNGMYSKRFVATISDVEGIDAAGLEITNGTKTWVTSDDMAKVVYKALDAHRGNEAVEAVDGKYYTAYTIYDIAEGTKGTLTVKAFVVKDGVKVYTDIAVYNY